MDEDEIKKHFKKLKKSDKENYKTRKKLFTKITKDIIKKK